MLRVFVVENHRDTLVYLQMYLESLGHTVETASTVKEAREALGKGGHDVLISDIGLNDGTGWELLRQVHVDLPRPLFAIAISGFGRSSDHVRSKEAGYRYHLFKPFDPKGLIEMLEEAGRELSVAL